MIKKLTYIALSLSLIFASSSCKDDPIYNGDCFIPDVAVNEVLNLNLPEYFPLQNLGEYILLEGGNKGIFVVHNYDDIYYALERTCPYQSDLSCSQIVIDTTNLQLRCGKDSDTGFVECCGSLYQFSGLVTQGPSRCNLKPYRVNIQSNTLYINN
jgi:nitrite reductase/ring-hydroxylating ferredoxin subunit